MVMGVACVHLAQYVAALLGTILVLKICVPPLAALVENQPKKVCPDLVGVGSDVPNVSPETRFELVGFTEPPFAFHVIVTVAACVHLAQYVVLLLGTVLELLICDPPLAALVLNHPAKLCPDLVGVGRDVPKVLPGVKLDVVGLTDPPFAFHVIVTGSRGSWVTLIVRVKPLPVTVTVPVRLEDVVLAVTLILKVPLPSTSAGTKLETVSHVLSLLDAPQFELVVTSIVVCCSVDEGFQLIGDTVRVGVRAAVLIVTAVLGSECPWVFELLAVNLA
jgi:hypothetical protein